jgi:DNA-binding MarR family transcriptional regulator
MPRSLPASDLTSHLGYWLRHVSNHVSHAFARKLETRNVTVAEWVVLRELYSADAVAPSGLADKLGLTRGAISKLAERLIAKGLVMRASHVSDGRAHTLALAAKGRSLIPKLAALADQNDAEFFDHLTAHERATVERVLKEIVKIRGLKSIPVD